MYFFVNIIAILFFYIVYTILSIGEETMQNPWYYWFYFSAITQTTVGYSGIRTVYDEEHPNKYTDVSILSIKSSLFKIAWISQLMSIIVIHSIFLSI